VILPGVSIGENSIVAAGATVTSNVAPNTLVVGYPARVIRELDPANPSEFDRT
jgi:acetyltransferase-like isoleucine patch superfamily enzyme